MKSIRFHLAKPFKKGIDWDDVRALKRAGKSIQKCLNEEPTIIYLTLTFSNRKLIRANTHEKVKPIWFNFDTQTIKSQMHGSLELNDRLNFLKAEVTRQYRKLITANPNVTLEDIKSMAEKVITGSVPDFEQLPMLDYLQQFIDERRLHISPLTTRKYVSLETNLKLWMEDCNIKPRSFFLSSVDHDFEFSFKAFMIRRKLSVNTSSKYIECLKQFMRWARKKEYHNTSTFEDFEIVHAKKEIVWLTPEELERLETLRPALKHLERIRRIYLFMIYTGQRFADYRHFKKRHVVIDASGEMSWHVFQRKQTKTTKVTVPLIPKAVALLKSFGFDNIEADDYVLPIGCNQYMNRGVKDLCKAAGIDSDVTVVKVIGKERVEKHFKKYDLITCHVSRKSMVSILMLKNLPIDYIASISGHQNLRTLRDHYLGLSEEVRRREITKAWE